MSLINWIFLFLVRFLIVFVLITCLCGVGVPLFPATVFASVTIFLIPAVWGKRNPPA